MSDAFVPTPTDPIVAPQPVAAPSWAARGWGGNPYGAAMAREHRAEMQRVGKFGVEDGPGESDAFSIARGLRSAVPALAGINAGLERAHGLLRTTLTGLNGSADTLMTLRDLLLALAQPESVAGSGAKGRDYAAMLATVRACFADARYGGTSLLNDFAGATAGFGSLVVPADPEGQTLSIGRYCATVAYGTLEAAMGEPAERQAAAVADVMQTVRQWISVVEVDMDDVSGRIAYNSQVIEKLSEGLGSLVDVDLTAEAARLKALQVQQQLSKSGVTLGNGTPSTLQALFK